MQDDFCCTVHLTADPSCSVDAGACPGGAPAPDADGVHTDYCCTLP